MSERIVVDVPKTYEGMMLRGCEQKTQRKDKDNPNSEMVPAQDKNGVPKWTVYLSVETKSSFGKKLFEEMEATVTSPKNPCESIPVGSYVTPEGLTEWKMPIGKGKAANFYYTAEAIRLVQPAQVTQPGQATRIAPAQPLQPARAQ